MSYCVFSKLIYKMLCKLVSHDYCFCVLILFFEVASCYVVDVGLEVFFCLQPPESSDGIPGL